MMPMIAVVDYCAGNLKSVTRALDRIGAPNFVTNDPADLAQATAVVVPGVGAAGSAMGSLRRMHFDRILHDYLLADRPYLGICLGLQLLFRKSAENDADTLGFFDGEVIRLPEKADLKVPHIGWNPVEFETTPELLAGIPSGTPFYYVHSYVAAPIDDSIVRATTTHTIKFPAVVRRGNVWATQFHPEKSGDVGLAVLTNFVRLAGVSH